MKRSIAGDATKLTMMKILTTFLTMLSTMLLARFRSLEEYGVYSQLQLVITIVVTVFMIGLPNSINYFLAKAETETEKREFLSIYYTLCTVLGYIAGVFLIMIIPVIEEYFNNPYISVFWYFLLLYPWTKIILSGIENILIVYNDIKKLVVFKVAYAVATLSGITICWLARISFYYYMILFLATEIVFSIWVYCISSYKVSGLNILFSKEKIKDILIFSLPLGLASVVGTISIELDKMLIGYFYNTSELAIYTNASKEMPVAIVSTSITAVLMPQLVKLLKKNAKEKAIYLWKNAVNLAYICISFISASLFVFAPDVITVLYSEKYLPGVNVFRIYSLVLLLRVTYFGIILNAKGKTKFIFTSSIISLVLNVILNWFGYYMFGFIGPAIATFVSIAVTAIIQLIYTSRIIKISFREIFPWRFLAKITMVNILMGIAFYIIKEFLSLDLIIGSILETVALGIVWGCVYLFWERKNIKKIWLNLSGGE